MGTLLQEHATMMAQSETKIHLDLKLHTVQSLYNAPHYNTVLDITQSCSGSQMFFNHELLQRNYRKMTI